MTNLSEELRTYVATISSSPKTTAVAASSSATLGAAALVDLIHGAFALAAIAAGVIASLCLARFHMANERNMRLKNRMLEQQLRDMGIDPDKE